MKSRDALADDVNALCAIAPVAAEQCFVAAEVERREVVGKRVEPDVDHLSGVVGNGNAPSLRARSDTRDTEVTNFTLEERQCLGARRLRDDRDAPRRDRLA